MTKLNGHKLNGHAHPLNGTPAALPAPQPPPEPRKARARGKRAKAPQRGAQAGWWAVAGDTGESVFVGGQRNQWFAARQLGTQMLNDARIKRDPKAELVHQDNVRLEWVEADERKGRRA